jgi:hypothetical protein
MKVSAEYPSNVAAHRDHGLEARATLAVNVMNKRKKRLITPLDTTVVAKR